MPVAEERGVTKTRSKSCKCEACKKGRNEPSKVEPLRINGYSSQPSGGWRKQMTRDEGMNGAPAMFFGVELETTIPYNENGYEEDYERQRMQRHAIEAEIERVIGAGPRFTGQGGRYTEDGDYTPEYQEFITRHRAWEMRYHVESNRLMTEGFGLPKPKRGEFAPLRATAEEAVSFAEPVGFWHAKHDGSVSGPEFASLPASMDYWYSIRADLEAMFTGLLHAGVRSHTGDSAGMHVSMSVESFRDEAHLIRFAQLVNYNAPWSERMSQRTAHSMSWGRLGTGVFSSDSVSGLRNWAISVMRNGECYQDRYCAINASCGGGRIEFRLPRGTLRVDRFYKNLEWVASMIEFTGLYAATDAATYMRWVMDQTVRFADLKAWLTEKFRLLPTSEGFAPAAALPGSVSNVYGNRVVSGFITFPETSDDDAYGEEEDNSYTCDRCDGLSHDMDPAAYQRYTWNWDNNEGNVPEHTYMDGSSIGPARQFYRLDDGSTWEHVYNEDGEAVDNTGRVITYPGFTTTRSSYRHLSSGTLAYGNPNPAFEDDPEPEPEYTFITVGPDGLPLPAPLPISVSTGRIGGVPIDQWMASFERTVNAITSND